MVKRPAMEINGNQTLQSKTLGEGMRQYRLRRGQGGGSLYGRVCTEIQTYRRLAPLWVRTARLPAGRNGSPPCGPERVTKEIARSGYTRIFAGRNGSSRLRAGRTRKSVTLRAGQNGHENSDGLNMVPRCHWASLGLRKYWAFQRPGTRSISF